MAISAGTTRPVQFLRRLSGNMEAPYYSFPVIETSTTWRPGDGAIIHATPDGKVNKATGAAATGIILAQVDGSGLVGFFASASSSAPVFPTTTGVQGIYVSPAAVTTNDPIPDNEWVNLVLALPDCIFMGHETNGATDITAPIRAPSASATGGLMYRCGLWVGTPTGETERVMLECAVTTNAIAFPINWAYPQLPIARSTSTLADPRRIKTGTAGTPNPAVEFQVVNSVWNPSV